MKITPILPENLRKKDKDLKLWYSRVDVWFEKKSNLKITIGL